MKKFKLCIAIALSASMLLLAACGKKQETTTATEATTEAQSPDISGADDVPVSGGWTEFNEVITPVYTEESKKAFDKAMEEFVGVSYEPAALLATQIVSGTNYTFLAKGTTVTAEPKTGWYFVVIYQDLEGNASVSTVNEIDFTDLKTTTDAPNPELVGGWEIAPVSDAITLSQDMNSAFAKASENYDGVTLSPVSAIGTQVVAGTNVLMVCQGTTVTADPVESLYFVTMYMDLEQNAEFTDVQMIDMAEYTK